LDCSAIKRRRRRRRRRGGERGRRRRRGRTRGRTRRGRRRGKGGTGRTTYGVTEVPSNTKVHRNVFTNFGSLNNQTDRRGALILHTFTQCI
jgi:hypothetical protein